MLVFIIAYFYTIDVWSDAVYVIVTRIGNYHLMVFTIRVGHTVNVSIIRVH